MRGFLPTEDGSHFSRMKAAGRKFTFSRFPRRAENQGVEGRRLAPSMELRWEGAVFPIAGRENDVGGHRPAGEIESRRADPAFPVSTISGALNSRAANMRLRKTANVSSSTLFLSSREPAADGGRQLARGGAKV